VDPQGALDFGLGAASRVDSANWEVGNFAMTFSIQKYLLSALFFSTSALALAPNEKLSPPLLADIHTIAMSDVHGKAVQFPEEGLAVFIEVGSKCPIVQKYAPTIRSLAEEFAKKSVKFYLVNSALHDSAETMAEEMKRFNIDLPTLFDGTQVMAKSLGFRTSSQAVVLNLKTKQILYRGSIDDSLNYFGQKPVGHKFLRDAVVAALSGKTPSPQSTRAFGCAITFR